MNTFVNVDCNDWHNIIERQPIQVERKYGKDAVNDSHNLIVLKKQKEPLTTTQILLTDRGVINISKF